MSEDVERVLKEHVVSPATGGTATGSTWRCTCGASATVDGVRSWADEKGRAHLAGAILAAMTPGPDVHALAEVRAKVLRDAADDLDQLQSSHDVAECAGYVEGEVGRAEAIENWLSVCDDPQTWLRGRAGGALIPDVLVPLTMGTAECADGLHEDCHAHETCQCGCHMNTTPDPEATQ